MGWGQSWIIEYRVIRKQLADQWEELIPQPLSDTERGEGCRKPLPASGRGVGWGQSWIIEYRVIRKQLADQWEELTASGAENSTCFRFAFPQYLF